jgi:lysophospholipase L1-like esterase
MAAHNRRHFFALAGGVAGLSSSAILSSCERAAATLQPDVRLKPPITYVAIGASDAAGVGVEDPQRDGWVPVLFGQLPKPAKLVNLGIPGIKLHEAIEVELPPALDANANLITVWLVVNDVLGGVTLDQYQADLDRLLGTFQRSTNAVVAVANIPDAGESTPYLGIPPAQRRAISAQWNDTIAATVQAHDALLVDLFARWPVAQHPEYIGPDGLHPTVAGYRALAATFLAVLHEQKIV